MSQTNIRGEFYYVWNFIGGLKEEIRKHIGLFQPKTLNNAINLAFEIEKTVNVGVKSKPFFKSTISQPTKQPFFSTYKSLKTLDLATKSIPLLHSTKPQLANSPKNISNLTYDEKRALGLCFICNDKWVHDHRCAKGIHAIEGEDEALDEEKKIKEVLQYEATPVIEEMMEDQLVTLSGSTRVLPQKL
jgi:hypothetical protein